jgi:hypothetical protein
MLKPSISQDLQKEYHSAKGPYKYTSYGICNESFFSSFSSVMLLFNCLLEQLFYCAVTRHEGCSLLMTVVIVNGKWKDKG